MSETTTADQTNGARVELRDQVMRETLAHTKRVGDLMQQCVTQLIHRAIHHDDSKFGPAEFDAFVQATPGLKTMTYGSDEYRQALKSIQPSLTAHYAENSHHPEYYDRGVNEMSLLDLLEMLCDWKAATERHADGSLHKSFEHNRERFGLSPQLEAILRNTAEHLGWL